jgi:very-short-patch-repair endonuclease
LDLTHLEERVALSQGMWRVTRVREAVRHVAWPDMRVAVEYDGIHHADPMQMRRDRRRLKALVQAGWTVIHATGQDLRQPDVLMAQIRTALTRTAA